MRSALIDAVIVGVGVGVAVLIIRALIGEQPLHIQMLAVLFAGMILSGFQLALSRRRRPRRPRRQASQTAVQTIAQPQASPRRAPQIDDRSPAWTGLAPSNPPPAHDTGIAPDASASPATSADERPGEPVSATAVDDDQDTVRATE